MAILILDASVIIDLKRGGLIEAAFKLDEPFVTPDLLYRNELEDDGGPRLLGLGLKVVDLSPEEVGAAQTLARTNRKLSNADCWALVCARRANHRLLSGDGRVRSYADENEIPCSGLLWLLDRIHEASIVTPLTLADGLSRIVKHRRARLPKDEVDERLARWRKEAARLEAREPGLVAVRKLSALGLINRPDVEPIA